MLWEHLDGWMVSRAAGLASERGVLPTLACVACLSVGVLLAQVWECLLKGKKTWRGAAHNGHVCFANECFQWHRPLLLTACCAVLCSCRSCVCWAGGGYVGVRKVVRLLEHGDTAKRQVDAAIDANAAMLNLRVCIMR